MSARKVTSRYLDTPGTGGKRNLKSKPPTPKQTLNSTVMSKSSYNVQADAKFAADGPSLAPKLIAPDWNLQCDLAYSDYLRALVGRQIVQESVHNYEEAIDAQLARQMELLRRSKCEQNKLVNEIEEMEIQVEVDTSYSKLEQIYSNINEVLRDYAVEENLKTYIASCESACNKLYLKNIEPFKSQEDYDKFSILLEKCTDTMRKLKAAVGNTEATQVLGERLQKYIKLQNELVEKQKMLSNLQSYVALLIFKNISNKFASIQVQDYNME